MKHLKLAKKNKEIDSVSWDRYYGDLVVKKIRARYSLNEELAILRQKDVKPVEFAEYNSYVEMCKAEVKAEMED